MSSVHGQVPVLLRRWCEDIDAAEPPGPVDDADLLDQQQAADGRFPSVALAIAQARLAAARSSAFPAIEHYVCAAEDIPEDTAASGIPDDFCPHPALV